MSDPNVPPPPPGSGGFPDAPPPAPTFPPSSSPSSMREPALHDEPATGPFFSRLFDMSFNRFVTPSIIKVLFILSIVVTSIIALTMLISGFATIGDGGILLVIAAPLLWLLYIIYSRVILEIIIVFFRIERNTRSTR